MMRPGLAPPAPGPLSGLDDSTLAALAVAGDVEATEVLLARHYGAAVMIARSYHCRHESIDIADLIQSALLGYMQALRRFDATRGTFGSYGMLWARRECREFLQHAARPVSVSLERAREVHRGRRAWKKLGAGADLQEVAGEAGVSVPAARRARTWSEDHLSLDDPTHSRRPALTSPDPSERILQEIEAERLFREVEARSAEESTGLREAWSGEVSVAEGVRRVREARLRSAILQELDRPAREIAEELGVSRVSVHRFRGAMRRGAA
jgi:RNA polymerase sigma factor (sigma-70 family)